MLHKVIAIIRRANHHGGFQAYYNNVQLGRALSGPTYDEARRDYCDYESIIHQSFGRLS